MSIDKIENCTQVATSWLHRLSTAAANEDVHTFCDLVLPGGWMRDLLCFSWEFKSMEGRDAIYTYLSEDVNGRSRLANAGLHDLEIETTSSVGGPAFVPNPLDPAKKAIQAFFTFRTTPSSQFHDNVNRINGIGRGLFRLLQDSECDGQWKAFTLFTNLEDLEGYEESKERPQADYDEQMRTWTEVREADAVAAEADPTVLIIGAGHAGLTNAARLGRLGIKALVVENTPRVGDVWRNRHPNLKLNTSANASSILYHPWPKTYPHWIPRDLFANFLGAYALEHNIRVWLSSRIISKPIYDPATKTWEIYIDRSGEKITVRPKHIVLATGIGKPRKAHFIGMEKFQGKMYHSAEHHGAESFKGKRAVVVGSGNSAADMCMDFLAKGASEITMVQRSPACVVSAKTMLKANYSVTFPENRPIEDSDFLFHSTPLGLSMKLQASWGTARLKAMDRELLEGLDKVGFKMSWESMPGRGEVGVLGFIVDRVGSGSFIDAGCGQAIIDGRVKIKYSSGIKEFVQDGIEFNDGTKISADVVVLAIGFEPLLKTAADIFNEDTMSKIGNKIWGLDNDGELQRVYRPSGQAGLWFVPGAIQHARFFSKHLALQILAEEIGLK